MPFCIMIIGVDLRRCFIYMDNNATVSGKYLMYRDKPLVRDKNIICYGDMTDDYILFLMILTTKDVDAADGTKVSVPDRILVQLLSTDPGKNPVERIAKQFEKNGLFDAMDIGLIWQDRLNNG